MIWGIGGNPIGKYHAYEKSFELGSISLCDYQFSWKIGREAVRGQVSTNLICARIACGFIERSTESPRS